jgi:hypothetical protein
MGQAMTWDLATPVPTENGLDEGLGIVNLEAKSVGCHEAM